MSALQDAAEDGLDRAFDKGKNQTFGRDPTFDTQPAEVPVDESAAARLSRIVTLTKQVEGQLSQLSAAFRTVPGIDDRYATQVDKAAGLLSALYQEVYQELDRLDPENKSLSTESVEDRIAAALFEDGVTKEKKKTDKEKTAVIQKEKVGSHPNHWYTAGAKANGYGSGDKFNNK